MATARSRSAGRPRQRTGTPRRRSRRTGSPQSRPSLARRVARAIWVPSRHAALAVVVGLLCGAAAARFAGPIRPPYAAIAGAIILYPVLVLAWRRRPRLG